MYAAVFHTVHAASMQALFTILPRFTVNHHMVRTDELVVVRRKHNRYLMRLNLVDNRGRKLIVKIIEMHDIRLKIPQYGSNLLPRLTGIYDFKRIYKLLQLSRVKVHIGGITLCMIADNTVLMLHAKIFYLMPLPRKLFAQLKNIRSRTAVWVQELIYH